MASPLSFLRAGPPPPKVALLSDALFFSRAVPITAGATAAEAAAQVELALEIMAPFPLPQLFYGWYWVPGALHAFVYAAYRRRFTADQTAAWQDAELVIPAAAAVFGAAVEPATTVVLTTATEITAVYWESSAVPARVLSRALDPTAPDEDRARVREALLHAMGGSKTVIDLAAWPVPEASRNDGEMGFRSGDFVSRQPKATAASLDVRDKGELALLRSARQRDVILWRVALGCAAALLVLGLGEVTLFGARKWQDVRVTQLNARKPLIEKIKTSQTLAKRIDELANQRLLPLEMVTKLVGVDNKWKPGEIMLTRAETRPSGGLYALYIEVQTNTNNAALINVYQTQIKNLPECEDVKVNPRPSQGDRAVFELVVTFKPGAVKPTPSV
ncbi:MAG: hypothetical protein EXS43_03975 [Opitutus sp.]|nr:hypothetical protein [Opitutus sp.]